MDDYDDCPYRDDEDFSLVNTTSVLRQLEKTHFKCPTSNKYIPRFLVFNTLCECGYDEFDTLRCKVKIVMSII